MLGNKIELASNLNNSDAIIIVAIISLIGGISVALINWLSKKEIKTGDHKECEQKVKDLIEEIKKIDEIIDQYEKIKLGFSLVFHEYERKWEKYPENMGMLRELKKAFDK